MKRVIGESGEEMIICDICEKNKAETRYGETPCFIIDMCDSCLSKYKEWRHLEYEQSRKEEFERIKKGIAMMGEKKKIDGNNLERFGEK